MTVPSPIVAPYVPFYAETQPYLTTAEFLAAPTGIDNTQLIPGGNTAANAAALATAIASASNYADSLCYQVLAATSDLQVGEYRLQRDGSIKVPLDFSPLVEITGVSVGKRAGQLTALTDLSGIWMNRKVPRIPAGSVLDSFGGSSFAIGAACARPGYVFAQVAYVNGYANTALAGAVLAGASSVTVTSALGIFPGMPLTINDDALALTEAVVVGAGYVQGSTTVPLVAALLHPHAAGTAVSALPRAVKQAVICLTSHLIKTRGAESLAMASVSGGPADMTRDEVGSSAEYEQAVDLLHPFRRVK